MNLTKKFYKIFWPVVLIILFLTGSYFFAYEVINTEIDEDAGPGWSQAENDKASVDEQSPQGASILESDSDLTGEIDATDGLNGGHQLLAVAPPPFSDEVYPCSDCHEDGPDMDTTPTEELYHDDIIFEHDPENLWCYSCHNVVNRDELHLSNGKPVSFTESYRLCGQCHGTQLRDWEAGDHGKRTGSWSGAKEYLLCASCHSPHSPKIKPIEPLAPPIRQEKIK